MSAVWRAGLSMLALLQLPTAAPRFASRCRSKLGGERGWGGACGEEDLCVFDAGLDACMV